MRALLLLLVFCNLLFFMWQTNVRQPELRKAEPTKDLTVPGLALLNPPQAETISEPEPEPPAKVIPEPAKAPKPTPPSVETPAPAPTAKAPDKAPELPAEPAILAADSTPGADDENRIGVVAACYTHGDFKTEQEALDFMQPLPEEWQAKVLSQRVWVDQGFWVLVPAPPTYDEARTSLQAIKAKGVKDYWLVPRGRNRGVISLGLFANKRRSDIRLRELEALGVTAQIEKKRDRVQRYRVQLILPEPPAEAVDAAGLAIDPATLAPQVLCEDSSN